MFLLSACACASTPPPSETSIPYPLDVEPRAPYPSQAHFLQRGVASWYGLEFHGRLTANGERYSMYGYTAAHKTLPFNTCVRVTNLRNGKETVVRINDRGPFVKGRIIDLSYAAARALAMAEDGVVEVRIEALGYVQKRYKAGKWVKEYVKPATYELGDFAVQVGSFARKENALRLHASLSSKYQSSTVNVYDEGVKRLYRVRVGRYSSLDNARDAAKRLQEQGFANAFAVALD